MTQVAVAVATIPGITVGAGPGQHAARTRPGTLRAWVGCRRPPRNRRDPPARAGASPPERGPVVGAGSVGPVGVAARGRVAHGFGPRLAVSPRVAPRHHRWHRFYRPGSPLRTRGSARRCSRRAPVAEPLHELAHQPTRGRGGRLAGTRTGGSQSLASQRAGRSRVPGGWGHDGVRCAYGHQGGVDLGDGGAACGSATSMASTRSASSTGSRREGCGVSRRCLRQRRARGRWRRRTAAGAGEELGVDQPEREDVRRDRQLARGDPRFLDVAEQLRASSS